MKFNNRNVFISPSAQIGNNVRIGDDTVIYDNVIIGDNTTICNNSIIGEPLNDYYQNEAYINPKTIIRNNSLIRSHAIIYAGCSFGENFSTGHRITIRENTIFGIHCRVGTGVDIQGNAEFGNYCWLLAELHISQKTKIGNFVFIYPYVIFTNDPHPPSNLNIGSTVGDFTQIAVSSIILPGIKIGRHAFIAASTLVRNDVPDYQVMAGNPGKIIKDIREIKSKEINGSHYPWPFRFKRGMPWEAEGFENWLKDHPEFN